MKKVTIILVVSMILTITPCVCNATSTQQIWVQIQAVKMPVLIIAEGDGSNGNYVMLEKPVSGDELAKYGIANNTETIALINAGKWMTLAFQATTATTTDTVAYKYYWLIGIIAFCAGVIGGIEIVQRK
jgi:hypothetical protein